jgi:hypothetical protein
VGAAVQADARDGAGHRRALGEGGTGEREAGEAGGEAEGHGAGFLTDRRTDSADAGLDRAARFHRQANERRRGSGSARSGPPPSISSGAPGASAAAIRASAAAPAAARRAPRPGSRRRDQTAARRSEWCEAPVVRKQLLGAREGGRGRPPEGFL